MTVLFKEVNFTLCELYKIVLYELHKIQRQRKGVRNQKTGWKGRGKAKKALL